MAEIIISSREDKVLNACHRLNAEAYEYQIIKRGKKLKQFTPCQKAEVLMEVIRKDAHFGTQHTMAAQTACECHPQLTEAQLMDYEYDPTYKLANYAGDLETLYPRLYPRKVAK